jgi:uncharacterized membrane protein
LTGILLVIFGNYGSFLQLWLIGALVLYVLVQITVIGLILPTTKELERWVFDAANAKETELPHEQQKILNKISSLYYLVSTFGVLLFILMILKPVIT